MERRKIVNYVRQGLTKGYSFHQLKRALIDQGIDRKIVSSVMIQEKTIHFVKKNPLLILILILAIAVRLYDFGSIPPEINQDEASIGYETWSLLHYGIDRHGLNYPVHLISWNSGQNALYAYFSMPFVLLFGLNAISTRIVNFLFGIVAIIFFYKLVKLILNEKTALLSAFLLAISPWHIMASRWGLESNIAPPVFLLSVYFLLTSLKNPKHLIVSFILFALTLYSYGSMYFVVPVFMFFSIIYLLVHKKIDLKRLIISSVAFLIVALPMILFIFINKYDIDSIQTPVMSIPNLPGTERYTSISFLGDENFLSSLGSQLDVFWTLLWTQNDKNISNVIPEFGYMFKFSFPIMMLGLLILLINNLKKKFNKSYFVLLWMLVSIVLGILIEPNINRVNIIFIPMIFLAAVAIVSISGILKKINNKIPNVIILICVLIYLFYFISFCNVYFNEYNTMNKSRFFFESFSEAINYADENSDGPICVTSGLVQPYISVLFYRKIDPNVFMNTVDYGGAKSEFHYVKSFENYTFDLNTCKDKEYSAYVFKNSELHKIDTDLFEINTFKYYSSAIRKK